MIKKLLEDYSPQEVLAGLSTALDKSLQEIKAGSAWSSLEIKRLNLELGEGVKIQRQPDKGLQDRTRRHGHGVHDAR